MIRASTATLLAAMIAIPCSATATISGKVSAVHDGDTLTIGDRTKIRLFGIDAPELRQQCRADAIHNPGPSACVPCGEFSRQALEGLVLGKDIHCTERGKSYDRVVAECEVGKVQIGPWMLSHGLAVAYVQYLKKSDRPAYFGAEASAKRAREGLWAMTWAPPADWRNRKARLECERSNAK